jgi:hypothetical protein
MAVLPSLVEKATAISLELVRCLSLLSESRSVPSTEASQLICQRFGGRAYPCADSRGSTAVATAVLFRRSADSRDFPPYIQWSKFSGLPPADQILDGYRKFPFAHDGSLFGDPQCSYDAFRFDVGAFSVFESVKPRAKDARSR